MRTIEPPVVPGARAARGAPDAAADRPSPRAPQRILMVVESSAGGTGRHVMDLAEGLIALGCEVHVISSSLRVDKLFLDRINRIEGLHHLSLPIRTSMHPSDLGIVRTIRRYMREHGPFAAIHGHSSKGGALARLAAMGTSVRAYYTLHGLIMMDPCLPRWKWLMYYTIEMGLALRTSRVIAVSPEEQRAAVKLGFGRSRVDLVPNGIGAMRLTPRAEARRTLNVSDDEIVIGFVGRLVEQKAVDVLIEAFSETVRQAPKARLALVGGGPLQEEMRGLARRLGVHERIIWLGERDAREVFAAFDTFAISSRKEGLPYVVLEALVTGLPVVATETSGVEILVRDGFNGIVVPPDNVEKLARGLIDLVCDGDRRARFGVASLKRAGELTIDAMVQKTMSVYQDGPISAAAPVPGTTSYGNAGDLSDDEEDALLAG